MPNYLSDHNASLLLGHMEGIDFIKHYYDANSTMMERKFEEYEKFIKYLIENLA